MAPGLAVTWPGDFMLRCAETRGLAHMKQPGYTALRADIGGLIFGSLVGRHDCYLRRAGGDGRGHILQRLAPICGEAQIGPVAPRT